MENTEKKQPLVQVKNLCKYFEISRKETLKAVDDLTFDIYKGETVSLVGESGCGKSTTGRTMIKLYNPTSGNVYYDGKDIFKYNHAEQKEFCKKVQMIFQNPYSSLNPRMTVKDIVGEGLKQHGMSTKDADAKVEQLLQLVLIKIICHVSHTNSQVDRDSVSVSHVLFLLIRNSSSVMSRFQLLMCLSRHRLSIC